jgi:hypothetical protein
VSTFVSGGAAEICFLLIKSAELCEPSVPVISDADFGAASFQ